MKKAIIIAFLLVICLSVIIKINSWQNKELAELKQYAYQQNKNQPLTVANLLSAFNDWEKTGFTKSPIMLEIRNKATLTIMEDGKYVKWAEVIVLAPNIKPESLTDNELTPIKKLLAAILPDWKEGESWLKNNLSILPVSTTKENWQLKLEYSKNTGLRLLASQILPTNSSITSSTPQKQTSTTTSQPRIDPTSADDFENLVVTNGRPLVFAASVEGEKGPAVVKSDSKFLAIWVTSDWDYLTDIDKGTLVKLHLSVFNQWRGKDDGIVMVFDSSDTKLASGNKYSIKLNK